MLLVRLTRLTVNAFKVIEEAATLVYVPAPVLYSTPASVTCIVRGAVKLPATVADVSARLDAAAVNTVTLLTGALVDFTTISSSLIVLASVVSNFKYINSEPAGIETFAVA